MALYSIFGAEIGANLVGGLTNSAVAIDHEVASEGSSGEVYPRLTNIHKQTARADFTTRAIADVLTALGVAGVDIAGLTGDLNFYGGQIAAAGGHAAGSVHKKYVFAEGWVWAVRAQCDHGGNWTVQANALSVGTAPVVESEDAALPTGLTDDERFTLGKITIGDVALNAYTGITIEFGVNVTSVGSESSINDANILIPQIAPIITIRGIDPDWFKESGAIPLAGLACTHLNTIIFARKRADKNGFVPDATQEHIKFTAEGLATVTDAFGASHGQVGESAIQIHCQYDGTNAPLTATMNQAIV